MQHQDITLKNSATRIDNINDKVKGQLKELYYSMKGSNLQGYKTMISLARSSAKALKDQPSVATIPRIHSNSPGKKKLILPERSIEIYNKLNKYYYHKNNDKAKKNKKDNIVYTELCKLHQKIRRLSCKDTIINSVRSTSPKILLRVPSLLVKTKEF